MAKTIAVSIMIPTYNQPEFAVLAIESALKQDYANLEVIVSDDSTNDKTAIVSSVFNDNKRFSYYKNEINIGRVANYRKLLFELVKGDWVLMLDGDDYLIDENYITKCVNLVSQNPDVILVGAGIKEVYTRAKTEKIRILVPEDSIFKGEDVLKKQLWLPNHQTDFYPRQLACKLDFYRDPSMASDSESLFRLCMHGQVAYLSTIAAVWRIHDTNTTYTLNIKKQIKELVFIDKVFDYIKTYLGTEEANKWRKYMYTSLTHHIFYLPKATVSDVISLFTKVSRYLSYRQNFLLIKDIAKSSIKGKKIW